MERQSRVQVGRKAQKSHFSAALRSNICLLKLYISDEGFVPETSYCFSYSISELQFTKTNVKYIVASTCVNCQTVKNLRQLAREFEFDQSERKLSQVHASSG